MIFTQLSGFSKISSKQARNTLLMPEVRTRASRILEGAARELFVSNSFYPKTVELYKRLTNGRACSCTNKEITVEKTQDKSLFLSDFVLKFDGKLNKTLDECPICFGVGLVGGYSRVGCISLVLDSTSPNSSSIDKTLNPPYFFKANNKMNTVTWKIEIPKYFTHVVSIAIEWKEEPAEWSFTVDGKPYRNSYLECKQGQFVDFSISMRDTVNPNAGLYCVFMQLSIGNENVQADMPRITNAYTGEVNVADEPQGNITINFDESVGTKISSKDVVVDDLGYIWRILEVENLNPMDINIGYTCQARLCRSFESYFILPSKTINKNYSHNYTFVS